MRTWNFAFANRKPLRKSAILVSVLAIVPLAFTTTPAAAGTSGEAGPATLTKASLKAKRATPRRDAPRRRLVAPTSRSSIGLKQLAHSATVYMKRGSCGPDCGIHKLAAKGNRNLPVQVWLTCPSGQTVNKLRVKVAGMAQIYNVSGKTNQQSVSQKINIKPWTNSHFEKACQQAFGGAWAQPGGPKVNKKTVYTTMKAIATPFGHCSGAKQGTSKAVHLKLKVKCVDRSYVRRAR
ncbi:MAG: hypothetical protein ACLFWF_07335 [Alphaproteobacteria bacterium]